jgi:hypothetical protein
LAQHATALTHDTGRRRYSARCAVFDAIAGTNAVGLVIALLARFRGANLTFVGYSLVLFAAYGTLWWALRRYEYPVWAPLMMQAAILGHLAGWFVPVGDRVLYVTPVFGTGMTWDKVIHAFNSLGAAMFVAALFRAAGLRMRAWEGFIVIMTVSGLGALIEIIEYGGTLILPTTSVGDYANNAQDLIANLLGAIVGWLAARLLLGRAAE